MKTKRMTPKQLYNYALSKGFEPTGTRRGKGSHAVLKHPDGRVLVVPDPRKGSAKHVSLNVIKQIERIATGRRG